LNWTQNTKIQFSAQALPLTIERRGQAIPKLKACTRTVVGDFRWSWQTRAAVNPRVAVESGRIWGLVCSVWHSGRDKVGGALSTNYSPVKWLRRGPSRR